MQRIRRPFILIIILAYLETLYFDTRPLYHIIRFYSFFIPICTLLFISYILPPPPHSFAFNFTRLYFTPVYKPYAEYIFLIPDDAVDRRKLGFSRDFNINFAVVLQ